MLQTTGGGPTGADLYDIGWRHLLILINAAALCISSRRWVASALSDGWFLTIDI
jgi:hypothetical protein